MIPFFIIFAVQQYFSYILYAIGLSKINFIYFVVIIILNTIFNFIGVKLLNLGVQGIALASSLSIICVLPIYIVICIKNNVNIKLIGFSKQTYQDVIEGVKNLGVVSIIEPIAHNSVRFILILIIAYLGQEMISAKRHASNFLTLAMTLSLSTGIIIQAYISRAYGEGKIDEIKELYSKYIKFGILVNFIFSALTYIYIYITLDFYTESKEVQKYIIICLAMGLFVEPMRLLSLVSKSHIRGLQVANLPFAFSFSAKLLIVYPMYYFVIKYTSFGIVGILFVEGMSYFSNFLVYTYMIKRKYKKLIKKVIVA
jgi:Na+-driven multidrug efflux pump